MISKSAVVSSLFVTSLLAGCGGESSESPKPQTDNTAPTIENLDQLPASVTGRDGFTLIFSEPLDISKFAIEISQYDLDDFDLSWNDDYSQVTVTPKQDWIYGTYSVTISGADNSGNNLLTISIDLIAPDMLAPVLTSVSSENKVITKDEAVVVSFSEAINPTSVSITHDRLDSDQITLNWSNSNSQLSLTPINIWPGGVSNLSISASDEAGNSLSEDYLTTIDANLTFEVMQSAELQLGSTADGDTYTSFLSSPYGNQNITDNTLWVASYGNGKLLKFNSIPENRQSAPNETIASIEVLKNDGSIESIDLNGPQVPFVNNGQLVISDYDGHFIGIYDGLPQEGQNNLGIVLGTPNQEGCSSTMMAYPEAAIISDNKLMVVDSGNSRILIWNKPPTKTGTVPDLVLGQNGFDTCIAADDDQNGQEDETLSARTLSFPSGIWSDGDRLIVVDGNRVLIWNTFPQQSFAAADIVLGQPDMTTPVGHKENQETNAQTLNAYEGVASNGQQIFVSDTGNHRILVWDNWPTENYQSADQVIGQSTFAHNVMNDSDQDGNADELGDIPERALNVMEEPAGLFLQNNTLVVSDLGNNRILIFNGLD